MAETVGLRGQTLVVYYIGPVERKGRQSKVWSSLRDHSQYIIMFKLGSEILGSFDAS